MPKNQAHSTYKWLWIVAVVILFATRFGGLSWGVPYPFHPDERNMVDALLRMHWENGFNPQFFAYGQLPLFLALLIKPIVAFFTPFLDDFGHGQLSLRLISAFASVVTAFYSAKTAYVLTKNPGVRLATLFLATAMPGYIVFAHYGTTESLLIMFATGIMYAAAQLYMDSKQRMFYALLPFICLGLGVGAKISFAVFAPLVVFIPLLLFKEKPEKKLAVTAVGVGVAVILAIISSPFYLLEQEKALGAIKYESDIGLGIIIPFYTRQFEFTVPFLFQLNHVFPYIAGIAVMAMAFMGFFIAPYQRFWGVMRFFAVIIALFTLGTFAKWSRFAAPLLPFFMLFCIGLLMTLEKLLSRRPFVRVALITLFVWFTLLQGLSVFSVYIHTDVRFSASAWLKEYISKQYGREKEVVLLQETANVVDLPIEYAPPVSAVFMGYMPEPQPRLKIHNISFNYYELEQEPFLKVQLEQHLQRADFIIIPSRRIFMNHTCYDRNLVKNVKEKTLKKGFVNDTCHRLEERYPTINAFYTRLFSGELPFRQVAEFSSPPRIEFMGKTFFTVYDEQAEESLSVFDHPTIRIFERVR